MRSIHVLAQNGRAALDFLDTEVRGRASVVERVRTGLPLDHPFWRWSAVPDWLTDRAIAHPVQVAGRAIQVPEFRLRPRWRLEGWRGEQNRLERAPARFDDNGNQIADPQYIPGLFFILKGPQLPALVRAVKEQSEEETGERKNRKQRIRGVDIEFREFTLNGRWVRLLRPATTFAALAAWGVEGHDDNLGGSYVDDLDE